MKFTHSGIWTFGTNASLSDKFKKGLFALLGKCEAPQSPAAIFGEAVINGEIRWEVSAELNVEDFIAIQREARDNDNHVLEWLQNYGKSLISGAGQVLEEAKKDVPEWQKIIHEYNIQEIKNNHEEAMMRTKVRKEERAAEKEADKE
jgi:hypothetical protein